MNTKAEIALKSFVQRFDDFLERCAALEEVGAWDVDRNGLMSAYFESDLMAVTLQIMSADGVFEHAEAEVISGMFGCEYTPSDLRETYRTLGSVINDYTRGEASEALALLRHIDPKLCDEYRQLILGAAEVVSAADGVAEGPERRIIERLRSALNQ
jgi:tellurite resistance protein